MLVFATLGSSAFPSFRPFRELPKFLETAGPDTEPMVRVTIKDGRNTYKVSHAELPAATALSRAALVPMPVAQRSGLSFRPFGELPML